MKLPIRLGMAALVLAGLAAYSNTAQVPLLFDDAAALEHNPSIRALGPEMLAPPHDTTLAGRPFANASFALNYALSGLRLAPLHFTNLALHLVAGLLLLALLRRTLLLPRFAGRFRETADGLALCAALLWLLHPLQTESVTYLVQRVETLAGLFLLLLLYAALRADAAARPFAFRALAVLACGLGMLSKETMAVAPVLTLLYDRTFLSGSLREALRRKTGFYAALGGTWVVLGLQAVTNPRGMSLGITAGGFRPHQYLAMQAGAVAHYLRLLLLPVGLTFDSGEAGCAVPLAHLSDWAAPAALLVALAALALWGSWRNAPAGFPALAFFILLAPSSSVVPIATEVISEHRLYLPSAAALVLLVLAAHRWAGQRRRLAAVLAAAAVLACAGLTFRRNHDYRSAVALWEDTVREAPDNARGWWLLADAYGAAGDRARARQTYVKSVQVTTRTCRRALQRDPWFPLALRQAAIFEEKDFDFTGDTAALDRAIEDYRRYLAVQKDDPNLQLNLAHVLEKRGRLEEAVAQYRVALQLLPQDAGVAGDAANCFARAGKLDEAAAAYRKALLLQPRWATGHYNRAVFLARTADYAGALEEFDAALALDPMLAVAWHRRGLVAAWAGRPLEAVRDLETAVRLEPSGEVMDDLAWLLATHPDPSVRQGPRALALAEKVRGGGVRALEVLAAAQAELGRFDEAQRTQARAAGQAGQRAGAGLQERIASYAARRPWRETPRPKQEPR